MSRYAVDVHLTISQTIYVSAYDAEDAREEAANTISEEDFDFSDAEIVIDILDKRPGRNDMLLGSASLRLKEISDQESHDFVLRFKMRMENGDLLPTESSLFFNVIFQYSKAQPVRARIAQAKEALRAVELELARMKAGLEPDGAAEEEEEEA